MRTGFIDDLRNCKQCGSLEHKNNLRDDLCPNCYYDVGRFKEERKKTKADNKWLNKWQKLKEWLEEKIKEYEPTYDEWMALDYDFYNKTRIQSVYKNTLDQIQKLEGEDE